MIVVKNVFQLKAKMSRTITVREKRKIDVKLASKRGYFLHRRLSLLYLLHNPTEHFNWIRTYLFMSHILYFIYVYTVASKKQVDEIY
jgi:hypothetical protein